VVGFLLVEEQEVESECLKDRKKWCFGRSYPAAANFARDSRAMMRSIGDLEDIFEKAPAKTALTTTTGMAKLEVPKTDVDTEETLPAVEGDDLSATDDSPAGALGFQGDL
jgi:hypothetical protein